MAGDKRLSMFLPFRSEKKTEAKFEVVNRKRSPLASSTPPLAAQPTTTASTASSPSPSTSKTTSVAVARTPTPFDDVARKVTAAAQPKRPVTAAKSPLKQHITATHHSKPAHSSKLKSQSSIHLSDAPLANLNVGTDLPPVPDYNSKSFAPPVTIQGRTVSLAKKDAPPRRKPPTIVASIPETNKKRDEYLADSTRAPLAAHHSVELLPQRSLESSIPTDTYTSTTAPRITADTRNSIQEEKPIIFKTNKSNDSILEPSKSNASSSRDIQSTLTYHIPGAFPHPVSRPHTPEPSVPQPLSKKPLFSPGYMEPPVTIPAAALQQSNRSSYASQGSHSEFFDAREDFEKSTPDLVHEQRSIFDDNTTPVETTAPSIHTQDHSFTLSQDHPRDIPQSYSVDSFANSVNSFAQSEMSQQSSIAIQPLNFHRKTLSGVSNNTVVPDFPSTSTHKKQLSLSDEIMRDIDNYRPGGLNHEGLASEDEDDYISPVTPLQMGTGAQLPLELPQRTNFSDPFDDDNSGDDEDSITPTINEDADDTATPRLTLANADDGPYDDDLFQDSSDEALVRAVQGEQHHDAVNALQTPSALHSNSLSRATSLDPQIDFVQTPVYSYNGAPDVTVTNEDNYEYEDSYTPSNTDLPRSGSYQELNHQLTPTDITSDGSYPHKYTYFPTEQPNRGFSTPDSPSSSSLNPGVLPESPISPNRNMTYTSSSSSRDNASSLSYQQSSERHNYHVAGDSSPYDQGSASIAQSSRYDEPQESIDERPRTFHVVNDGQYSDSDSDPESFDADAGEQINQDYSFAQQAHMNIIPPSVDDTSSGDVLSFTARSPINSEFNIGSPPQITFNGGSSSFSDADVSFDGRITPQRSIQESSDQSSQLHSEFIEPFPSSTPINQPVYDTRIEEKAAPVQNLGQFQGKSRRPPPGGALAVPTRVARSTSFSSPVTNYNSIQEDVIESPQEHHIPEKSKYVEMLRLGSGTTNTNVSATTWGLPIGIAEIDHSRFVSPSAKALYKRPTRLHKSDLKHGKIKQRQLALEVGDDEDDEVAGTSDKRESNELKRFESTNSMAPSMAPSMGSPTMSMTSLSPRKDLTTGSSSNNTLLNRSGTLLTDKLPQVSINVGRNGTLRDGSKAQMTLFIANPDN